MSGDVQLSVQLAIEHALSKGHEYVTVEHLLLAILDEQEIVDIIEELNGDVTELKSALDTYLDAEIPKAPAPKKDEKKKIELKQTLAFQRVQ